MDRKDGQYFSVDSMHEYILCRPSMRLANSWRCIPIQKRNSSFNNKDYVKTHNIGNIQKLKVEKHDGPFPSTISMEIILINLTDLGNERYNNYQGQDYGKGTEVL